MQSRVRCVRGKMMDLVSFRFLPSAEAQRARSFRVHGSRGARTRPAMAQWRSGMRWLPALE
jgi:hypothetical protein